jgi:hypothetical protein
METKSFNKLDEFIANWRLSKVKKYVSKGDTVLDFGCGYQAYFLNGMFHNPYGAARTSYYYNNKKNIILEEYFYINGILISNDKPSIIKYHSNGNKSSETYSNNGISHRTTGPYHIEYDQSGKIIDKKYALKEFGELPISTDEELQRYVMLVNIK